MLRLCASADVFNRSYTTSGMFFNVNVVGMSVSNQSGTIMVSTEVRVKPRGWAARELRANPSLEWTATGKALGPRTGQCHHPLRGPSALPASAPQLKR
jgi:hypothetical protein